MLGYDPYFWRRSRIVAVANAAAAKAILARWQALLKATTPASSAASKRAIAASFWKPSWAVAAAGRTGRRPAATHLLN